MTGDADAISESAQRGALLFFRETDEGGAGCASSYSGDSFTDEQFYVLAVPQIGPGKHADAYADPTSPAGDDLGRFHTTYDEADCYAFRTPSLFNVEVTGPYGHDGAYATLEGIVRHHLNPAEAVRNYDFSQIDPAVQTDQMQEKTQRALDRPAVDRRLERTTLKDVRLTDRQVQDILDFLRTLTDPCVKDPACLAPCMPAAADADPDGLRLIACFGGAETKPRGYR